MIRGVASTRLRQWAAGSRTVRRWREARYHTFVSACAISPTDTILDVGAGGGGALERFNRTNPITAVDLEPWAEGWLDQANVTTMAADARALPFRDREFDVAFSNSVIEHVPPEDQQRFADEVRRVSARYFVQTPNKWFPIEPHYQLPLFQFLPRRVRKWLNGRFALGWQPRGHWEEITLLSARDLSRLFPDARIVRERMLGLTKSVIAVRGTPATDVTAPAATRESGARS
jgi:SAM-dependent methyltransferase